MRQLFCNGANIGYLHKHTPREKKKKRTKKTTKKKQAFALFTSKISTFRCPLGSRSLNNSDEDGARLWKFMKANQQNLKSVTAPPVEQRPHRDKYLIRASEYISHTRATLSPPCLLNATASAQPNPSAQREIKNKDALVTYLGAFQRRRSAGARRGA